jgi:PAS domain S-box-containing protein
MIKQLSSENEEVMRLFIIAAACIGAILTTIFSLTHGIFEVYPFLYILPIILVVYFYPKRAVTFSLAISLMYISLIYLFGFANPEIIAIATAWFAIFITLGVVSSSYANNLQEERMRIRHVLDNSQDGIFCFDLQTRRILEINLKCAQWLRYDRSDLLGKDLDLIWAESSEREQFITGVRDGRAEPETEGVFRGKDGSIFRFVVSVVLASRKHILCSAIDITGNKIVDEEIRRTLEDLEEQVKARTAHLEKINQELQAEILEHRRYAGTMLSDTKTVPDEEEEKK